MIASDLTIKELCQGSRPMIDPFVPYQVKTNDQDQRIPSYGLSSYGYDIRLRPQFEMFSRPCDGRVIDVMDMKPNNIAETIEAEKIILPPGGFVLGVTHEYFIIPEDYTAICVGKSTWARTGVIVNVTPLEAGWEGNLVVEITNGTGLPIAIYANVGIAQLMFLKGDKPCEISYATRGGKYQNQTGITHATV